jgi:hypothetical protein
LLFHFPPEDTKEQRRQGTTYIAACVRAFRDSLGSVTSHRATSYQEPCYDFSIAAGTREYWVMHSDLEQQIYRVSFEKVDSGYVIFDFCNLSGSWQIAAVRYALPMADPVAQRILGIIGTAIYNALPAGARPAEE